MRRLIRSSLSVLSLSLVAACSGASNQAPKAEAPPPAEKLEGPAWTSAKHVGARCKSAIDAAQELRAAVKAKGDVLNDYNRMLIQLENTAGAVSLIANTHPDKSIRESAEKCEREIQAVGSDITLDRGLYDVVAAVPVKDLDDGTRRFKEKVVLQFQLSGVDKDEATRNQLKALKKQMVEVGQTFQRNIREDLRMIETSPDSLKGLPADFIEAHKPNVDGKVVLNTSYPDYFPVQKYAEDEALRESLVRAFLKRGYPANEGHLTKLLELRHQYATLLGFVSWADYNAQDKMAKSADRIESFTKDIAKVARPRMNRDLKTLLKRKKKDNKRAKAIQTWDRFYYTQKVQKEKYSFDASAARSYFQYPAVLAGILDLYGELFGLTFEKTGEAAWHPSVDTYVMKTDGAVVGKFYLDMHPRDGKYSHAAMFPMTIGREGGELPEASLVCNFPDPSAGSALMEHNQVVTFFHEFGHLIHHLLARRSPWVNQSGINTEWDFVEAPSQLLEEWAWDPAVLARFAKHVETKEPIPEQLVKDMRAANEFGTGIHIMRQVFYQAMSFYLHARDPSGLNLVKFTKEMQESYSPYPYIDDTHVYASFGHLEGYSSMYYTYQWSLSLAKDIFTRFSKSGVLDKATALDYRAKILEPGGMKPASALVEDFLGRPSTLDAYEKWLEGK